MFRHEAVSEDAHATSRRNAAEELQIQAAILGREEDRLAVVAALRDVVCYTWNHDAGTTRHTINNRLAEPVVSQNFVCPLFLFFFLLHSDRVCGISFLA
jgi:hypothetical protein